MEKLSHYPAKLMDILNIVTGIMDPRFVNLNGNDGIQLLENSHVLDSSEIV